MSFASRWGLESSFDHELLEKAVLLPPSVFSASELETIESFVKASGVRPEGTEPFNLEDRPYLKPLYQERRDNPMSRLVIMKAAQTGLTIKLLYRSMWWCADSSKQVNTALVFPNQAAVYELHDSRFAPMINSSQKFQELLRGTRNKQLIQIGLSNMRFRGMRTGVGVDSFPSDVLELDEVRLMSIAMIERLFLRVTNSKLRFKNIQGDEVPGVVELNSTAGFPGMDIDRWFMRSTQNYWRTPCVNPSCKNHREGIVLPMHAARDFESIVGRDGDRLYYRCPDCLTEIPDEVMTRQGWYTEANPDARDPRNKVGGWIGYQFSQMILGSRLLPEIYAQWSRGDNHAEVVNSRFGLPFRDPNAVPAPREVVLECVDPAKRYMAPQPEHGELDGAYIAIGIDQRAPEKHAVVYKLGEHGSYDWVHAEVIEASGLEASQALERFCRHWRASIIVIDGEPSYDLAVQLARVMPKGTVWLADYVNEAAQPVEWVDSRDKESIRKSTGQLKYEYRVLMDRYKAMDWALTRFPMRQVRLPVNFQAIEQDRTISGVRQRIRIADEYLKHLENIARATIPVYKKLPDGSSAYYGDTRSIYRHLELDPHFAHATLYALVGISRRIGTSSIYIPDGSPPKPAGQLDALLIPAAREAARAATLARPTCGTCKHWKPVSSDDGLCGHIMNGGGTLQTGSSMMACPLYALKT